MGPRVERKDECSPSKRALLAEKVVTMLQQRNQVFEKVFCADVGQSEMASFAMLGVPICLPTLLPRSAVPASNRPWKKFSRTRSAPSSARSNMWAPPWSANSVDGTSPRSRGWASCAS